MLNYLVVGLGGFIGAVIIALIYVSASVILSVLAAMLPQSVLE